MYAEKYNASILYFCNFILFFKFKFNLIFFVFYFIIHFLIIELQVTVATKR